MNPRNTIEWLGKTGWLPKLICAIFNHKPERTGALFSNHAYEDGGWMEDCKFHQIICARCGQEGRGPVKD